MTHRRRVRAEKGPRRIRMPGTPGTSRRGGGPDAAVSGWGRREVKPEPLPFLLGVAGDPVSHSLSPRLQNAALRALGLPYHFRTFSCSDGKSLRRLIQLAEIIGLKGLNVTTPLKDDAARLLMRAGAADDEVRWSGSANTLVLGRRIRGASTDGRGGVRFLHEAGMTSSSRILILGLGRAARNLLWHLMKKEVRRLGVVTRRPQAVRTLLKRSGSPKARGVVLMEPSQLGDRRETWDVVVSTWPPPAVRRPMTRRLEKALGQHPIVVDLNYGAGRDRLHRWAVDADIPSHDGRGFLLHQGALSFRMWTGKAAPMDVMREALGLN